MAVKCLKFPGVFGNIYECLLKLSGWYNWLSFFLTLFPLFGTKSYDFIS